MMDRNSPSLTLRARGLTLGLTTAVVVAVDQAVKWYAIENWRELERLPPRSYFYDVFRLTFATNEGAFLGLGHGLPDHWRFLILTVANGLMLLGLAAFLLATPHISRWSFTALTLIVAGGAGNMIDRIRFEKVIDFWNLGIGGLRTGIFNVADIAISLGFLLLLPSLILGERCPESAACDPTPSRT